MENNNIHPLKSKTLWTSLILAAAAFYPPVSQFMQNNVQATTFIISTTFAILRLVTKGKISVE